MFPRYLLSCRLDGDIIYSKYFTSINRVVEVASGFDFEIPDIYISVFDELYDNFIDFASLKKICKEFHYYGKI